LSRGVSAGIPMFASMALLSRPCEAHCTFLPAYFFGFGAFGGVLVGPSRVFGFVARDGCGSARIPTLVGLASRPEFLPAQVAPSWVKRTRSAVGPCPGCAVFPEQGSRDIVKHPRDASRRVQPPSRVARRNLAGPPQRCQLLSWAFAPYSAHGGGGPLVASVACSLRSALRV
jgi:hypothetical protein